MATTTENLAPPAVRTGTLHGGVPFLACVILLLAPVSRAAPAAGLEPASVERFAELALACVHKEYPNKIAHVLSGDQDVRPPRELTPAFHGCYDWHSAVHGHWLLARLARLHPQAAFAPRARAALARSLTPENVAAEVRYLQGEGRVAFERPYQTAFAFGLILDWTRAAADRQTESMLLRRAEQFHLADRDCPLEYEPSGHDFLSPCLAEADLLRRVLPAQRYAAWLGAFLPGIPLHEDASWLQPAVVSDPSDPKLAHLDGLNLSRAWMLEGIAAGLPEGDPRRAALLAAARTHREAGLRSVTGEHYEGGHWLASFATYLVTGRGLGAAPRAD
jgi:hypothetical protein